MKLERLGLVPTVFVLIFIIKTAFGHFEDPDFYWHIKTGEIIVNSGSLPSADMFSYTQSGKPWVLHEWLFQAILYLVFSHFGFPGVSIFVALFYTATCYFIFKNAQVVLEDNASKALIITLLSGSLFMWVAPRPFLPTFLFFALFFYRLANLKYCGKTSGLWQFPLIMLLWVNLHGGYFIGIFLVVLFLLSEMFGMANTKERKVYRQKLFYLGWLTALTVLMTLVNPYFIHQWLYPFQVIGMDASKNLITEWRSPDFHQLFFLYFLAIVAMVVGLGFYSGRRIDFTEFVLPAAFVGSAFISIRNIPLAAIALAPSVAMFLKDATVKLEGASLEESNVAYGSIGKLLQRALGSAVKAPDISPRAETFLNMALIVLTIVAVSIRQKEMVNEMNKSLPVAATDFLVRNHIRGNVFNAYHYGGYLIYRFFPDQKVFIDGRADMYGDGFIKDFVSVYQGQKSWAALFDRYKVDYVVCGSDSPIRQVLMQGGSFKLVFDDRNHSVLLKNVRKFDNIIERYSQNPARK